MTRRGDSPGTAFRLRPTVRCGVLLASAALLFVLAGACASYALAATACALGAALAGGLVAVATAIRRERQRSRAVHPAAPDGRALDSLLPQPDLLQTTWERLDQRGRVVETFQTAGELSGRGLYRRLGETVELRDCFGLWRARGSREATGEVCIPPLLRRTAAQGLSERFAGGQSPFLETQLDTAMVRPYERGDSLRAISWRQSAHHGRLMSFETQPAGESRTLVLVDTTTAGNDDAVAIEAASAFAHLTELGERPLMTDGVATAGTLLEARRFAAALRCDEAGDRPVEPLARNALALAAIAGIDIGRVVLVTAQGESELVHAARQVFRGVHVTILPTTQDGDAAGPERAPVASGSRGAGRDSQEFRGAASSETRFNTRRQTGVEPCSVRLASLACCLMELAAALTVLAALVEPGAWLPFAGASFALAAIGTVAAPGIPLFQRHRAARIALATILPLAVLVAALHVAGTVLSVDSAHISPIDVLTSGIADLYFDQWVPLTLTPASDAALVIVMALVAVVLNGVLTFRRARPAVAVLPLTLLAVRLVTMGTPDRGPWIGIVLAGALLLIALIRPPRRWPLATLLSIAIAMLCATALAPQALEVAARIAPDLNLSSNQLAARTVNPLMDLRRDLVQAPEATALTYTATADTPLYLRLNTLDELDSGIWQASSQSGQTDWPLGALFALARTGGQQHALADGSPDTTALTAAVRAQERDVDVASFVEATVTIGDLSSRFLPMPSGTYGVADAAGTGTGIVDADWRWDADDSLTSASSVTANGLSYRTRSAYLAPLSRSDQLESLQSLPDELRAAYADAHGDGDGSENRSGGISDEPATTYRKLPRELPTPVQAVVAEAQRSGVSPLSASRQATNFEQQLDIMSYLLDYFDGNGFAYSLDAPNDDASNNLEAIGAFLERKSGYCVHYASSLAVLGRAMGLSTRIALGYRAASTTSDDGEHLVTNRNLHAWTEIHLSGIGWAPFDVTPGLGSAGAAEADASDEPDAPANNEEASDGQQPEQTTSEQQPDAKTDRDAAEAQAPSLVAQLRAALEPIVQRLRDATPYLAGIAIATIALSAPRAVRRHLRTRRLATAQKGGPAGAQAAWTELCCSALDAGATLPANATEEGIVAVIIAWIGAAPGSPAAREIEQLANACCRACYGRGDANASARAWAPSPASLQQLIAVLDRSAHARAGANSAERSTLRRVANRAARFLFPRSLLTRRL